MSSGKSVAESIRTHRLAREVQTLKLLPGITCTLVEEDKYDNFEVTLSGPDGSPYENGTFKLEVTIPAEYPFVPPLVRFKTPVYHPNIDEKGRICMDLLKPSSTGTWAVTVTLESVFVAVQSLLRNPNPDDPLVMTIANEYKDDIELFLEKARTHTRNNAVISVLK